MAKPWEKYQTANNAQPEGPWKKYAVAMPSEEEKARVVESQKFDRPLEAAGKAAANVGLLGYLPEVEALSSRFGQKLADVYYGVNEEEAKKFGLQAPSYEEELKGARQEQKKLAEYNPTATTMGTIGGALAQAPLMSAGLAKAGIGAGGGLLARLGKSAGTGAALGAVQNPGELEEGDDQVNARLRQAATGGLLGAGGEALGSVVGRGIDVASKLPSKLREAGAGKAVKSAGAMLKDYRRLMGKNRVEEVGNFAIEKGYVRPGSSFESIAEETAMGLKETGEKIGEVYKKTKPVPQDPTKLTKLLSRSASSEAPKIGKEAYSNQMKGLIEEIVSNPEVQAGNPKAINEVIQSIDDRINWQKAAKDLPENQKGLLAIRRTLRAKNNQIVKKSGDETLKALNKDFQNTIELNTMAKDRVARESANAMFGLRDTGIGIGTGALAGGAQLAQGDIDAESMGKAALLGLGAAAASKGLRTYGNPLLSRGLLKSGDVLEDVVANTRGLLPDQVRAAIKQGLIDPRSQVLQSMQVNKEK